MIKVIFMKLMFLLIIFALSATAHSADWTPLFKHLQNPNYTYTDEAVLENLMKNLVIDHIDEESLPKNPLTYSAKSGNYPIRSPYQQDLLPARYKYNPNDDMVLEVTIPMQNATLYNMPLKSLGMWYGCFGCGFLGYTAEFAPMTDAQYRSLKSRIKFPVSTDEYDYGEPMASFVKDGKKVLLVWGGAN